MHDCVREQIWVTLNLNIIKEIHKASFINFFPTKTIEMLIIAFDCVSVHVDD